MSISNTNIPNWSFQDIYDLLMREIEPELLTNELPNVATRIDSADPKESAAIKKRYAKAMQTFLERYELLMTTWKDRAYAARVALNSAILRQAANEDEDALLNLELEIRNLSSNA